jgi:hypothetical protein
MTSLITSFALFWMDSETVRPTAELRDMSSIDCSFIATLNHHCFHITTLDRGSQADQLPPKASAATTVGGIDHCTC